MKNVEGGNTSRRNDGVERFKGFVGSPAYTARQEELIRLTTLPPGELLADFIDYHGNDPNYEEYVGRLQAIVEKLVQPEA